MSGLLTVESEDLARLTPDRAVGFFRRLLWAEASVLGIGKNLINVPDAINASDGGVDAEVRDSPRSGALGLIKQGLTCYQIKTGNFSLSKANVGDLFFKKGTHELHPRVRACFEQGGTFVVVLFGSDNPDRTDQAAAVLCREFLGTHYPEFGGAKIEVWRQNQLCGFFSDYQTLAADLKGRGDWGFQTHGSWSLDEEMLRPIKLDDGQRTLHERFRALLRDHDEPVHVRVCGQAGIGKTRLVLEATRIDDLSPLVAYYRTAASFRNDALFRELHREDSDLRVILVVDDCDSDDSVEFWNILRRRGPNIKFISLYQDTERLSGTTVYLEAQRLSDIQLSAILQEYGLAKLDADHWAPECDGSPRVAHVFGQNLEAAPKADVLRNVDTVRVWDRFIAGIDHPASEPAESRRRVLRYLALFKRFGYGRHLVVEARAIHALIERNHPEITWAKFQEIIAELRQRKLLQGETTLYITPTPLHIKLLAEFWDLYGPTIEVNSFVAGLNDRLREWFFEMFEYASTSLSGKRIVSQLLGPGGPFADDEYLKTRLGASFFLALAKADPEAALRFLQNTLGAWDVERRQKFITGRREVVWALEAIAIWNPLFRGAARLLLALGEAENETYANNASGVFANLFSPGPDPVAPTEASPEERFPILREAFESDSSVRRLLAIRACDKALESGSFIRATGAENQAYRGRPKLWKPETYGEYYEAYRRVWRLLCDRLPLLPSDEGSQVVEILLNRGFQLSQIGNLADMVFDTLRDLSEKPYVDKRRLLNEAIEILHIHGNDLAPKPRSFWEDMERRLTGEDFHSLFHRFVGIGTWHDDLQNADSQSRKALVTLAAETIKRPELLKSESDWLVTLDAANGYAFGYELGMADVRLASMPTLLEAQRKAGKDGAIQTLGGYLRALLERDRSRWETEMTRLAYDATLNVWLPELAYGTELNNWLAGLILDLAKKGSISTDRLKLFAIGDAIQKTDDQVFGSWMDFLLAKDETGALVIALELFHAYYIRGKKKAHLPLELTERLLWHPKLLAPPKEMIDGWRIEYRWAEIAEKYVGLHPVGALKIAERLLKMFGTDGTIVDFVTHRRRIAQFLESILASFPNDVWEIIKSLLDPPSDARTYSIWEWLRSGAMLKIPEDRLWQWVDEDVEDRAWRLARFVPKDLFDNDRSLSRQILIRYGEHKEVRRELTFNFSSEMWAGPASTHYEDKKTRFLALRARESHPNVRLWIDEYIARVEKEIDDAKIEEERFA